MENLSTFVRTLGNQFIRGRKIFTGIIGLEGTVLDGTTSAGTSGQVLSTTGSGVQWITVGSSNVGELDDLTDVQVGTPSNGQLLRYDSESGLWYNWTPNYLDTTDGLNDLNGVVITSPVSNQFLKYNGINWVNANVLLSTLGDTSISSPSADQILVYGQPLGGEPGVNVWYNKTHNFLTTATNIDDLANVVISEQSAGDILRYNGTNWVNVSFSTLENDTLDSVTDRGNTTTNTINVGGVTTDYVQFDTAVTLGGDESQGYMAWNSDVDTVSVYPYDSTWFNIGQDMHWHVKNGTPHTIERGQVVMATGAVGASGKIEAGLMVSDGTVSSKYILGIAIRDIASGEFGKVASQGIIRGVNTSLYQDGTLLWADPSTPGGLTSTEPDAPNLRLPIAFVVSAGNNGAIAVRITTGNVLHELHDVDAPSPATGDLLRYSAITGIWENWTPTYISGFTEADPIFVASPAHGIASTDITNWNTAYGWGNHATAGYLTALPAHNHDDRYYTETEVNTLLAGKADVSHTHDIADITGLQDALDSKLESESDTLDSVTGRGNTTSNTIYVASARGSSGTYGTGIYGDNSGASVQFGTSAAVDSLGIIGAYSSQFNINSKNGPLSFQYYGTEYMNISAAGALKLNSYGAGLLKTDASGNVTVDTNVYITADDQELTWTQETKELSISDGNTITLDGLASIADVEGYGYITTEVDTLNTVTTRGATTANAIETGNITISTSSPDLFFETGATHYNWMVAAQENVNAGFEISVGSQDADSSNDTWSPKLVILQSGNVGIGTTSPGAKLDIHTATNSNGLFIREDTDDSITHNLWIDSSDHAQFYMYQNGQVNTVSISSSGNSYFNGGNVGIGTTSPITKLAIGSYSGARLPYINGTGNTFDANGITITSSNTGNASIGGGIDLTNNVHSVGSFSPLISFSALSQSGSYNNNYAAIYGILAGPGGDGNWNTGHIAFATSTSFGATEKMRITSSGNVGIGTTSPATKLQVKGGDILIDAGSWIKGVYSTETTYRPLFGIASDRNTTIVRAADNDAPDGVDIQQYDGTSIAYFKQGGNVGIGTTSPSYKLDVAGTGYFGGGVTLASTLYVSSTLSANSSVNINGGNELRLYNSSNNASMQLFNNASSGLSSLGVYDSAAATYRMYINTSGNVGIGTTSPAYKLEVYGSARVNNTLWVNNSNGTATVNAYSGGQTGTYLAKSSSATANFTTTGVSYPRGLGFGAIIGQGNTTDIPVNNASWNGGYGGNIGFWSDIHYGTEGGTNSIGFNAVIKGSGNSNSYGFFSDLGGVTDGVRYGIYTKGEQQNYFSGNVGIGTTSPLQKLSVRGIINSDSNNDYYGAWISGNSTAGTESYLGLGPWYSQAGYVKWVDNSRLSIYTYNTGKHVTLQESGGNVGIGTTSPGEKLTVIGDNAVFKVSSVTADTGLPTKRLAEFAGIYNSGSNGHQMFISSTGGTGSWEINQTKTWGGIMTFGVSSNGTEITRHLAINSSGNVGIGTTSPSYKLDVNGSFNCTSMNVTNDITTSTGNVVLANDAGIYSFSDTVQAGDESAIFRILNDHGAQAFRVSFVCNTSNYSVAKIYEVVHAYGATPVAFKVVDTGPWGSYDFDVTFVNSPSNTGIECSITNNSSLSANIVTTIFLAGSPTAITITEL